MTGKKYTNIDLAKDYRRVWAKYASGEDFLDILSREKKIRNSSMDIPQLFKKKGNLSALKVKGVGIGTKKILELILREGAEKADRIITDKEVPWIEYGIGRENLGSRLLSSKLYCGSIEDDYSEESFP